MPHANTSTDSGAVIFFDGVCGLCNRFINSLLRADHGRKIRFSPLQGEAFSELVKRHPELASIDSMVLWEHDSEGEHLWLYSDASLRAWELLGGGRATLARTARLVPRPIRNFVYRCVAVIRYRIFGKSDVCRVPTPAERERFLD